MQYPLSVQTPQYRIDSVQALQGTPIGGGDPKDPGLLASYARVSRGVAPTNVTHYNVAPTVDVLAQVASTGFITG